MDRNEITHTYAGPTRENKILEKSKMVAMVMQKPSESMDIDPILLIFVVYVCLIHFNLHENNEGNLP